MAGCIVVLWLYTIINQKQKFMGCVMELALQLTHTIQGRVLDIRQSPMLIRTRD